MTTNKQKRMFENIYDLINGRVRAVRLPEFYLVPARDLRKLK